VLSIYALAYGLLIWLGDGIPYVMDNNESFSSMWHAKNLFDYPISTSFGVTDESYGTTAAAHPYIYTHQGNFPRVFAYAIYLIGARSIESQILVTTFTVGAIATLFAYFFFARLVSSLFAFLACLVLITDYLLVAQWQIVTYRVWHEFFVFSSMLCVYQVNRRGWFAGVLILLNFICLYYYEFVFAGFVTLCTGLFALYVYRKDWRSLLKLAALVAAGSALGIVILAAQLNLHLGWKTFLDDAYFTFVARNHFHEDAGLLPRLIDFFDSKNIVFWYNLEDGGRFKTLPYFIASVTFYEWQIHTPYFSALVLIVLAATAIGVGWRKREAFRKLAGRAARHRGTTIRLGGDGYFLGIAAAVLPLVHVIQKIYRGEGYGSLVLVPAVATVAILIWLPRLSVSGAAGESRWARARRWLAAHYSEAPMWLFLPSVLAHRSFDVPVLDRYSGPYMAYLAVYFATLIFLVAARHMSDGEGPIAGAVRRFFASGERLAGRILVGASAFLIGVAMSHDRVLLGMPIDRAWFQRGAELSIGLAASAGALLLYLFWEAAGNRKSGASAHLRRVHHGRLASVALFSSIVAGVLVFGPKIYNQYYALLWKVIAEEMGFDGILWIAAGLAILVGLRLISVRPVGYLGGKGNAPISALLAFLAAGAIAYAVTFEIFAAYIFTGYRFRLTPFTVFHTDALIALAMLAVISLCAHSVGNLRDTWKAAGFSRDRPTAGVPGASRPGLDVLTAIAGLALALLMGTYWFATQAIYLRIFPPSHYSVLNLLDKKYTGSSIITNTYAAPFAWATHNWAYLYNAAAGKSLPRVDGRETLVPDGTYMWFSDKKSNPKYRKPEYYLCIATAAPNIAVGVLSRRRGLGEGPSGCEGDHIVRTAQTDARNVCPPIEVAELDHEGMDTVGYARWALVALKWAKADASCLDAVDRFEIRPMLK
jgi:hypothetical protein